MAWTAVGIESKATASGSETTLDSIEINVAAGDLLVVLCRWDGATTTAAVAATTGEANAMTMEAVEVVDSKHCSVVGYKIGAAANATATFRLTLGAARTYRYINVMQFRPDSGETVTKVAGPGYNSGTGTAIASDSLSPAGSDLLICGFAGVYDNNAASCQIGADEADDIEVTNAYGSVWYKIYTESQTDITANATLSGSQAWIAAMLAFNSAVAAGGTSIPVLAQYYRRLRS